MRITSLLLATILVTACGGNPEEGDESRYESSNKTSQVCDVLVCQGFGGCDSAYCRLDNPKKIGASCKCDVQGSMFTGSIVPDEETAVHAGPQSRYCLIIAMQNSYCVMHRTHAVGYGCYCNVEGMGMKGVVVQESELREDGSLPSKAEPMDPPSRDAIDWGSCQLDDGTQGTCMTTSKCAGLGRDSAAGHCSGGNDIQCCLQP